MATRRPGVSRRPQACQLAGLVERCHTPPGREASCGLCSLVDFTHPTTCDAVGRYPPSVHLDAVETLFWAHLARRTDGGPADAAELALWNHRRRQKWDRDTDAKVRLAIAEQSSLPDEAPF